MARDLSTITSYTHPSEITTVEEADRLVQVCMKRLKNLPQTAPRKMRVGFLELVERAERRRQEIKAS